MTTKLRINLPPTREELIKRLREIDRTFKTEGPIQALEIKEAFPALFKAASSVVKTKCSAAAVQELTRAVEESRAINAKLKEIDRLYKERGQICGELSAMPLEETKV